MLILFIGSILLIFPFYLFSKYIHIKSSPNMEKYVWRCGIYVIILQYITTLISSILLGADILDDESYILMLSYVGLFNALLIYLLHFRLEPDIDVRKIAKNPYTKKLLPSSIISVLLFLALPFFTIDLYLKAYGFDLFSLFEASFLNPEVKDQLNYSEYNDFQNFVLGLTYALVIYFFIIIACIISFFIYFKKIKKNHSPLTVSNLNTKESPIVFLRSFELNKSSVSLMSLDEHLCEGFSLTKHPVISLADPDESFTDGSIKIQAHDETWKEAIVNLFSQSKAVIMFEGKSDGLNWEIDNIKKYISHDRFFIATPPDDYRFVAWVSLGNIPTRFKLQVWWSRHFSKRSIRYAYNFIWKRFRERLKVAGIYLQEEQPGSGCLINFDESWHQKSIFRDLSGNEFFVKLLSLIPSTESEQFDYSVLKSSIEDYEVKGEVTPEMIKSVKRFYKWVSLSQILIFAIYIVIIFLLI